MINVILPILENVEGYQEFINRENSKDTLFFVGITEKLKDKLKINTKNVSIKVFADNSNIEQIINSLHSSKLKKGKILVARRPLTHDEFVKLRDSQSDIATLKAKHNRFVSFIKRCLSKLIKKIFAFTFFEDISAICFAQDMFELMSVCPNLSMASRLNKYIGISVEEIVTNKKQVKKQYSRLKNILKFLMWTLLFAGSVAGGVCVCIFTPLHTLIIVVVIFWILVALMAWLTALLNFIRTIVVGNLKYGRAQEII